MTVEPDFKAGATSVETIDALLRALEGVGEPSVWDRLVMWTQVTAPMDNAEIAGWMTAGFTLGIELASKHPEYAMALFRKLEIDNAGETPDDDEAAVADMFEALLRIIPSYKLVEAE